MTFQPEQIYLVLAILAFMGAAYVYQRRQAGGGSQKVVGANFTTDLSALAEQGTLDPVSGRICNKLIRHLDENWHPAP